MALIDKYAAGIAFVYGRAARQQRVRKGWPAVVLQRTKHRVRIDLIGRPGQVAAAIIAAKIVSMRSDGAAAVEDVFA